MPTAPTSNFSETQGRALIAQGNDSAQDLAAKLIAHQTRVTGSAGGYEAIAGALNLAASKLSRWVGPEGCSALLTRCLNSSAATHPVLRNIKFTANSALSLTGVEESAAASGDQAVAAALNAAVVELFELLMRVVGVELTLKLAEQMTSEDVNDKNKIGGK